ncbi:SubName: Full=Uncharacterized protein {ECO:0000313/EMBL:CCA71807.1} [Serendipita indica DSM 11827]|nr:SubName: Full=Uncharacterized protein {ECO:0000313/EMBL:CCA71807.1} [Serendipita indica DSM 11827]
MPTIEVLDDEGNDQDLQQETLNDLLETLRSTLKVPKQFDDEDWAVGEHGATLIAWRNASNGHLKRLWDHVQKCDNFELQEHFVSIIGTTVPLAGSSAWTKPDSRSIAHNIVNSLGEPTQSQIRAVLLEWVRPAFEATASHTHINMTTGSRSQRGPNAPVVYQDDDDNVWKENPGMADVILWCISSLKIQDWEVLWPLLIPPILAYMDDWQAIHRIQGIALARKLIEGAPPELLKRSGIDQLMRLSLETSLLRYGDPQSPTLFKHAMLASLELVDKTTKKDGLERHTRLFALLGDSMIGGTWSFGYREPLLIQASYDVLPNLLDALGVAFVRYLKAIVPQLVHTISSPPEMKVPPTLREAALRCLIKVVDIGASRVSYWSGEIISGIAKALVQSGNADASLRQLVGAVLHVLLDKCPDTTKNHLEALKELDPTLRAAFAVDSPLLSK